MHTNKIRIGNSVKALALASCVAIVPVLGMTGCAGDRYTQSTGEHIDDMATSSRVKKALAENPEYKFGDVNVTTFKGVVQLSGFVNTSAQKTTAGMIASRVEGARGVENKISIKP